MLTATEGDCCSVRVQLRSGSEGVWGKEILRVINSHFAGKGSKVSTLMHRLWLIVSLDDLGVEGDKIGITITNLSVDILHRLSFWKQSSHFHNRAFSLLK